MAEEEKPKKEENVEESAEEKALGGDIKEKFQLIPLDQLTTPKGLISIILILGFEIVQAVFVVSGIDVPAEAAIHIGFTAVIGSFFGRDFKSSVKQQVMPLIVGAIPLVSDFLPEQVIMLILSYLS